MNTLLISLRRVWYPFLLLLAAAITLSACKNSSEDGISSSGDNSYMPGSLLYSAIDVNGHTGDTTRYMVQGSVTSRSDSSLTFILRYADHNDTVTLRTVKDGFTWQGIDHDSVWDFIRGQFYSTREYKTFTDDGDTIFGTAHTSLMGKDSALEASGNKTNLWLNYYLQYIVHYKDHTQQCSKNADIFLDEKYLFPIQINESEYKQTNGKTGTITLRTLWLVQYH